MKKLKAREIGRRCYKVRPDERLIGERDGWEIAELGDWSDGDWVSLKVFDTRGDRTANENGDKAPRLRVYQIGYNTAQGRMARNVSWGKLMDNYPSVAQWVLDEINGDGNGSGSKKK